MEQVWFSAALWLILALIATLLSIWFRISTALSEIVVGTVAQLIIGALIGTEVLGAKSAWVSFLAGTGAIVLTFLAGAELDPGIFRTKWKEATVVGLVGFFAPFLGAAAVAHFVLKWSIPVELAGRSCPVYHFGGRRVRRHAGTRLQSHRFWQRHSRRLLRERSRNRNRAGPHLCAVHDADADLCRRERRRLRGAAVCHSVVLSEIRGRVSELEAKYILFLLFGMGGLAAWAGSEAVLPAYIIGMVLAGTVGKDHVLVRRLRTLTFGLLTPFYFIRAGSLVSVPALIATPFAFLALFAAKMVCKMVPLVPTVRAFNHEGHQGLYYSLMMSTGLTFGTISALFGSESPDHHRRAVFLSGRDRDRQRRDADGDRQRLVHAQAPPAQIGAEVRPMATLVEDAGGGKE